MSLRMDSNEAAAEALDEAMSGLARPESGTASGARAAIVFATSHHAENLAGMLERIRSRTEARALIAATGTGVIGNRGEIENMPGLAILLMDSDRLTVGAALIPNTGSADAVDHLRSELPSLYRERGILLVVADPRELDPEFLSRIARDIPETPVVGAAAGWCDSVDTQSVTLAADGDISDHGCAALHIAGCIDPLIGVAQSILPEGIPMPITDADGRVIRQIGAHLAGDVLMEFNQSRRSPPDRNTPVEVYCTISDSPKDFEEGRYLVRNILSIEPAMKQITIAESVRPGQYIAFGQRTPKGARRSFKSMLERTACRAAQIGRVPRAAILLNCCARGRVLYGRSHVDLDAFHEYFPDVPIVGMFGFAEIGPMIQRPTQIRSAVLNHTAVLVLLCEPMEALGTT